MYFQQQDRFRKDCTEGLEVSSPGSNNSFLLPLKTVLYIPFIYENGGGDQQQRPLIGDKDEEWVRQRWKYHSSTRLMLANSWESASLRNSQGFKMSSLSPLGLWLCTEYSGVTGVCPLNWTCHLELRAGWPRKKTMVRSRERSQRGRLGHMSQRPSESHLGESEAWKEVSDVALSRSCVG